MLQPPPENNPLSIPSLAEDLPDLLIKRGYMLSSHDGTIKSPYKLCSEQPKVSKVKVWVSNSKAGKVILHPFHA